MAEAEGFVTTAPSQSTGGRTSEEIRSEIERTRADMDETLAALESKLAPRQLGRDALHHLKDRSTAKAGKLRQVAREHPLPTVAVGLGAGLLLGWRFLRAKGKTNGR
jgi:ElaB/YqjD/DUF883 family membrane-anchored ribosome-binding protein